MIPKDPERFKGKLEDLGAGNEGIVVGAYNRKTVDGSRKLRYSRNDDRDVDAARSYFTGTRDKKWRTELLPTELEHDLDDTISDVMHRGEMYRINERWRTPVEYPDVLTNLVNKGTNSNSFAQSLAIGSGVSQLGSFSGYDAGKQHRINEDMFTRGGRNIMEQAEEIYEKAPDNPETLIPNTPEDPGYTPPPPLPEMPDEPLTMPDDIQKAAFLAGYLYNKTADCAGGRVPNGDSHLVTPRDYTPIGRTPKQQEGNHMRRRDGVPGSHTPRKETQSRDPKMRKEAKDVIPGGTSKTKEDFPKEDVKKGVDVEMEHTTSKAVAEEIAVDHLAEDKDYYKKLETIHKEAFMAGYMAKEAGMEAALPIAWELSKIVPLLGAVPSGIDVVRHGLKGEWGGAALDALGTGLALAPEFGGFAGNALISGGRIAKMLGSAAKAKKSVDAINKAKWINSGGRVKRTVAAPIEASRKIRLALPTAQPTGGAILATGKGMSKLVGGPNTRFGRWANLDDPRTLYGLGRGGLETVWFTGAAGEALHDRKRRRKKQAIMEALYRQQLAQAQAQARGA
jgi:hypothetical protein